MEQTQGDAHEFDAKLNQLSQKVDSLQGNELNQLSKKVGALEGNIESVGASDSS